MYTTIYNKEILPDVREGNIFMFVYCNEWTTSTKNNGNFGSIECCINKVGISNILSIPKLGGMGFRITYDTRDGHYIFHTKDGEVQLNKDKMGIRYIDSNKPQDTAFVQTTRNSFEGLTKEDITVSKLSR